MDAFYSAKFAGVLEDLKQSGGSSSSPHSRDESRTRSSLSTGGGSGSTLSGTTSSTEESVDVPLEMFLGSLRD